MSITLRSRRGPIGRAWHAAALRTALEGMLGPRTLASGRRLARAGGVQWLDVVPGAARAEVISEDGAPHPARLEIRALRDEERVLVLAVAATHPDLVLRMTAGDYPESFERDLAADYLSLLPRGGSEVSFDCTCLDWPGPCQHVSALLYVLVEAVEEQPMLLATIRGIRVEELVGAATAVTLAEGREADDPGDGRGARLGDAEQDDRAPEAQGPGTEGPGTEGPGAEEPDGREAGGLEAGAQGRDEEADDQDLDEKDLPDPLAGFDPHIADPSLLAEALGPEAARIIGEFYRDAPPRDEDADPAAP